MSLSLCVHICDCFAGIREGKPRLWSKQPLASQCNPDSEPTNAMAPWASSVEDVGSMPEGCGPASVWQPPRGTPAEDEWFLSFGGPAPRCPAELAIKASSGPITLDVLQGEWMCSSGAHISVAGTLVHMNGHPLKQHKVELNDDGTIHGIGTLWRLDCWLEDGAIQFRSTTFQSDMEARKEIWTRHDASAGPQAEKLRLLTYGNHSPTADLPTGSKDAEDCALLAALVAQWREEEMCKIRPCKVVPDFVNRSETGLGVELVHYIAGSIQEHGFKKRRGMEGHDIPVVVREAPRSIPYEEALSLWRTRVAEEEGFPPICIDPDGEMFTSLGNGHFFQALNLFANTWSAINERNIRYIVGDDSDLAEAIEHGVPSIVLKPDTPRPVRAKIAYLLNAKREFCWTLDEDGTVDVGKFDENMSKCSQFEWLSRGMDNVYVNCLVRTHLGIQDSKRMQM